MNARTKAQLDAPELRRSGKPRQGLPVCRKAYLQQQPPFCFSAARVKEKLPNRRSSLEIVRLVETVEPSPPKNKKEIDPA
jgi:hypothetical protein